MSLLSRIRGVTSDWSAVSDYLHVVKEIAAGADNAGPPSPPPWLPPLLEDVGDREGVPGPVLAGLAAILTGYDVEHPGGILGAPHDAAAGTPRPTVAGLAARDAEHVLRVRADVEMGARHLRALHAQQGDWCRALSIYCGGELRAGEVVGALVLISLRHVQGEDL